MGQLSSWPFSFTANAWQFAVPASTPSPPASTHPSACCFKKLESKRSFRQYKHHAVRDWRCVIFRSEIPVHVPTLFFDV